MEITVYPSPLPPDRVVPGSFVDRNPNLCYLMAACRHAVMIDSCSDVAAVRRDLQKRHLQLDSLLITHFHHDHLLGLREWLKEFPSLPIGVHKASMEALAAAGVPQSRLFPLSDGMIIKVGDEPLQVMAAPGHTGDSLCFWDEAGNNFMSGDVIFGGNIGCSDYRRGGNRNIFYQTIVKLLKILPPDTHIYPGHRSEHRQGPPPYELAAEKTDNPYLANALAGKRGNFDRALRLFSQEFEYAEVIMLSESHIDAIEALEKEIWIPGLQAPREVIGERMRQGHRLLTIKTDGTFAGMVGWCYSPFSLEDGAAAFPRNFRQFSDCQSCRPDHSCSAFIYNVGVKPDIRRQGMGSLLLQEAFGTIGKDGISQVFLDSRMASYNGSTRYAQEEVIRNEAFHEAVDRYFITGQMPPESVLTSDPTVSFYMKNGFWPWIIRRDFIPDESSGHMRVICYLNLVTSSY